MAWYVAGELAAAGVDVDVLLVPVAAGVDEYGVLLAPAGLFADG